MFGSLRSYIHSYLHSYEKDNIMNYSRETKIDDALDIFLISREAMFVTNETYKYYKRNLNRFLEWLKSCDIHYMHEITANTVRIYLSILKKQKNKNSPERTLSDSYIHSFARCIRTFLRFSHAEGMMETLVVFDMPKIAKKKLRSLNEDEIALVFKHCYSLRDRCIVTLVVDTGLRLTEVCNLNWGDVDLIRGTLDVLKGKGQKYRLVACGTKTKKILKQYKMRYGKNATPSSPLFLTKGYDTRLEPRGLQAVIKRISVASGVEFSAHALRRTFAKFALKAGMDLIYIQRMMGHEDIETTRRYIQDLDDSDVILAAKQYSPMDWLKK